MKNEEALYNVRKKVSEVLNKENKKIVFGWRGEPEPSRNEGEVWEGKDGKTWTIKNGIKQTVTKLDDAKTPWWCPKCSKPLNHRFDIKFWKLRGHCMDCQAKSETEMRLSGNWKQYEKNTMLRNYLSELRYKIEELQDYHDTLSKPEFVNADDTNILMIERWDVNITKVQADIKEEISNLEKLIAATISEHGTGEEHE
jgi:hypothetical protein